MKRKDIILSFFLPSFFLSFSVLICLFCLFPPPCLFVCRQLFRRFIFMMIEDRQTDRGRDRESVCVCVGEGGARKSVLSRRG